MTTEDRYALLESWLASVLPGTGFGLAPASSDASFRRYFRLTLAREAHGARTLIAMDAPPPMEDCRPFVHVAALLADAGVHAPRVLAQDLGRGFLLLTDLGTTTYLDAAYHILHHAGQPLRYEEITERAVQVTRRSDDGECGVVTRS